eukprot:NODE_59_length_25653_cov_0.289622.p6 type:complete len:397 gc:universal NODE_59_length_25653_cov_0.289622:6367-5177(-)
MCYSSFGKVPEIQRAEWRVQGGMKRGIESSDEESNLNSASSIYEYDDMTPHQKKIKMAKEYIEELKNNMEEEEVEETLQKEIEEVKFEKLAEFYDIFEDGNFSRINAIPTSIASTDEMTFLGCDNGDLWIYGVGYKCKMAFDSSVTLTTSPNNKFLVVGCDKTISLYEIKSFSIDAVNGKRKYIDSEEVLRLLKSLNGHRKRVTFLEFDLDSSVLYSVSNDRSLKVWSIKYSGANQVNDSGYVDTLFGHQDVISGMALLTKGKPITVGNRDKTTRVFNVANSSQMVYRVPHDSDACSSIAVINQRHFVVGTLSGQLLLFNSQKKRPIHTRHNAHSQNIMSTICGDISVSNPISHVVTIPFTDVVVSSSHNQVIMWKCDLDSNSFSMLKSIQMVFYS